MLQVFFYFLNFVGNRIATMNIKSYVCKMLLVFLLTCIAGNVKGASASDSIRVNTSANAATNGSNTPVHGSSGSAPVNANTSSSSASKDGVPPVVHGAVGDQSKGVEGSLKIRNAGKRQQFSAAAHDSFDKDILSPKSVTFSVDGKLFYVNSLEGCRTVIYDAKTLEKVGVVEYEFSSGKGHLWGKPSGFYKFTHYSDGEGRAFLGKPVESAWSHSGRYLWVPFYRRSFDMNAQDPSAIAVIDRNTNKIVRMMETGPLPKMVEASPDGRYLAVTHWGDNTVGIIDISSSTPEEWHHLAPIEINHRVVPNYPLNVEVNRDTNSGWLLRGTVFTPDSRYMLISGMAGPLSVVDMKTLKYLGSVQSLHGIRHLIIHDGYLYGSRNVGASVLKVPLSSLVEGIEKAQSAGSRNITFSGGIKECKVGGGARTLEISPDGKYLFVACNSASAMYVVDAATMLVVDNIRVDSYPVGLAISKDGRRVIVTSQGRKGHGGNAVNIFDIERPDLPVVQEVEETIDSPAVDSAASAVVETPQESNGFSGINLVMLIAGCLIVTASVAYSIITLRRKRK